jgi:hypothetical protein
VVDPVRDALAGERVADARGDLHRPLVDERVDLVGAVRSVAAPAATASGFPDRVPGLVDGPGGARWAMTSARPAEGRRRQPAAHDLAEGEQVGRDPVEAVPARSG